MHVPVRPALTAAAAAVAFVAAAAPASAAASLWASPSEGLSDNEVIAVTANGFSPHAALTLVQCADPRDPDNGIAAADPVAHCNPGGAQAVTATAGGHVDTDFPVRTGPFGTSGVVCNPTHDCMLVLATAGDTERAEMTIKFGAGTVGPGPAIGPGPVVGPAPGPVVGPAPGPVVGPAPAPAPAPAPEPTTPDPAAQPAPVGEQGPTVVPADHQAAPGAVADVTRAARRNALAQPRLAATGRADTALASTGLALTLAGVAMLALVRRPEEA